MLSMLHSRFSRLATVLFASATIFSSCQKDKDFESLEMDKVRIRGANSVLNPLASVGRAIFFDANLSNPMGSQSCASCHMPQNGFAGEGDGPGFVQGIGQGAVTGQFGGRKPPVAAYATFSPQLKLVPFVPADPGVVFHEPPMIFKGGLFWDGRASGLRLGNPAAEQALGPFLNPVEHNVASKLVILETIKKSNYYNQWKQAFGFEISTNTQAEIDAMYDNVGRAIAAYEATSEVNKFSSKYDAFLKGKVRLSEAETRGLALFSVRAECYGCHIIESPDGGKTPPLFTDYQYHNIGLPKNLATPNKSVLVEQDLGLGGELQKQVNGQFKYPAEWRALAVDNYGKFKTPSLRNVAAGRNRRYMHNGIFNSLEQVVHFYNTRSVPGAGWGQGADFKTWAELGGPEVNMNLEIHGAGNLGLTAGQEADLVAFLKTLTDGWSATSANTTVL
jgi:cytochrome c peroxidase